MWRPLFIQAQRCKISLHIQIFNLRFLAFFFKVHSNHIFPALISHLGDEDCILRSSKWDNNSTSHFFIIIIIIIFHTLADKDFFLPWKLYKRVCHVVSTRWDLVQACLKQPECLCTPEIWFSDSSCVVVAMNGYEGFDCLTSPIALSPGTPDGAFPDSFGFILHIHLVKSL